MKLVDFCDFVYGIVQEVGFLCEWLIFGGDYLGFNCWQNELVVVVMEKLVELIKVYVVVGFSKIYLDVLMFCVDDLILLDLMVVVCCVVVFCKVVEEIVNEE